MSPESPDHPGSPPASLENDGPIGDDTRYPVRGLRSHNIVVDGKRTSIRLDPISLQALNDISRRERVSVNHLCTLIEERNKGNNFTFTAAIRIFLLSYYKAAATDEGHRLAGHGRERPLGGTPFEEPASLKLELPKHRNGRGRPPQASKAGTSLEGRSALRLGDASGQDSPVN